MNFRFSGHESFALRYAWLPKALHAIKRTPRIFSEDEDEAMVELGVGKNMVRSMRFWVEACGMAEPAPDGGLRQTWLGQLIFDPETGVDPYLEDIQTLWLIHWKISTLREEPLFAWHFLFNRWLEPEFTSSRVLTEFQREAVKQTRNLSTVTLEQHFGIFLRTYLPGRGRTTGEAEDSLDCPLNELELIEVGERETGDGRGRSEAVYAFRREDKITLSSELFEWCLLDYWSGLDGDNKSLNVAKIASGPGSPGTVFKIPEQDIYARLALLDVKTCGMELHESDALPQVHKKNAVDSRLLLSRVYARTLHG